jgi:hypothetical protein
LPSFKKAAKETPTSFKKISFLILKMRKNQNVTLHDTSHSFSSTDKNLEAKPKSFYFNHKKPLC